MTYADAISKRLMALCKEKHITISTLATRNRQQNIGWTKA